MELTEHHHSSRCPHCGKAHDRASNAGGIEAPADGDLTFCIVCGKWAFFDSSAPGGTRSPSVTESVELATDPRCYRVAHAWAQASAMVKQRKAAT